MAQYVCNPITVDAFQIINILSLKIVRSMTGSRTATVLLDNGDIVALENEVLGGRIPNEGDYFVRAHKPDEYEYIYQKHVFEAKYTHLPNITQ